jgi:hypothetical protein
MNKLFIEFFKAKKIEWMARPFGPFSGAEGRAQKMLQSNFN